MKRRLTSVGAPAHAYRNSGVDVRVQAPRTIRSRATRTRAEHRDQPARGRRSTTPRGWRSPGSRRRTSRRSDELGGENRLLARLAQRLAVVIVVDDRLADDQRLAARSRSAGKPVTHVGRVAAAEAGRGSSLTSSGKTDRWRLSSVDELKVMSSVKTSWPPRLSTALSLERDAAGVVGVRRRCSRALWRRRRDGEPMASTAVGHLLIGDVVDAVERRDRLGAQRFGEHRADAGPC